VNAAAERIQALNCKYNSSNCSWQWWGRDCSRYAHRWMEKSSFLPSPGWLRNENRSVEQSSGAQPGLNRQTVKIFAAAEPWAVFRLLAYSREES